MYRFYICPENVQEKYLVLSKSEAKHAFSVLRLKKNKKILVFDGKGRQYLGRIESLSAKQGEIHIEKVIQRKPKKVEITLAAAFPKQSKFDEIVDKATQLGVSRIIPLLTRRTIVKISKDKLDAKLKRWKQIAIEAAKQCGCVYLPEITDITSFDAAIKNISGFDLSIIASLDKDNLSIKNALKGVQAGNIIVFIGPEGDFDEQELSAAKQSGATAVSLGENVLRCDTAVTAVLSILNYELRL